MSVELDAQLKGFLDWADQEKRNGYTLSRLFDELHAHETKDEERHMQVTRRMDRHAARLTGLEQDVEDTGRHLLDTDKMEKSLIARDLENAKKELEKKDERSHEAKTWWRRQGMLWAAGLGAILASAGTSACVQLAMTHLK